MTQSMFSTLLLDAAALKCLSTLYPSHEGPSTMIFQIDALILIVVLILANALLDTQTLGARCLRSSTSNESVLS